MRSWHTTLLCMLPVDCALQIAMWWPKGMRTMMLMLLMLLCTAGLYIVPAGTS